MSRATQPAFPNPEVPGQWPADGGLTIREEFAKTLLPAVYTHWRAHMSPEEMARDVTAHVDAMLAELAKPKELPLDEHGNTIEPYHALGEFLHSIGWKAPCDAQWTKLRDNAQKIAALASAVQP